MSQVITNAFEQYWQSSLAAEQPVVLDEFILADIPNLDITSPIDPDTGLPPESQIVHRQNVDQRGRINNNAVAYTIVMDTTVGDFSFNAMYLRNKQNGVIGMIVYKGRETKLKTDQTTGQTGNSLVKSMLMGYDQAAEATLTNVDAGTWQIDYAARLRGQDEDLRQLASQLYGHHTFIGDGFKVVQQDGGHQVTQGVAIIGGLRIELKQDEVIHPGTKPIGVWVDVHRSGSLLSEHQNHFTIITSVADLTDHVDNNGYPHYVAKLGTLDLLGAVDDERGVIQNAGNLGETRHLWARSLAEAGYHLVDGSFESGAFLAKRNDAVLFESNGKCFVWTGEFPSHGIDIPKKSTPESTGGASWRYVDDSLRGQLFAGPLVERNGAVALRDFISIHEFGVVFDSGVTDNTAALNEAFQSGKKIWINDPGEGNFAQVTGTVYYDSRTTIMGPGKYRPVIKAAASMPGELDLIAPINETYSSFNYLRNILMFDLCVDANGFNRTKTVGYVGEWGRAIRIGAIFDSLFIRVNAVGGPQHGIDVACWKDNHIGIGHNGKAIGRPFNVILSECDATDWVYDDGITTHGCYDILIEKPTTRITDTAKAAHTYDQTQKGIEVDDGSINIHVDEGRHYGNNTFTMGFSVATHANAPAARGVHFSRCKAEECLTGFGAWADPDTTAGFVFPSDKWLCRNITFTDCTLVKPSLKADDTNFPSRFIDIQNFMSVEANGMSLSICDADGAYYTPLSLINLTPAVDVKIKNIKITGVPGIPSISHAIPRGAAWVRISSPMSSNIEIDGFNIDNIGFADRLISDTTAPALKSVKNLRCDSIPADGQTKVAIYSSANAEFKNIKLPVGMEYFRIGRTFNSHDAGDVDVYLTAEKKILGGITIRSETDAAGAQVKPGIVFDRQFSSASDPTGINGKGSVAFRTSNEVGGAFSISAYHEDLGEYRPIVYARSTTSPAKAWNPVIDNDTALGEPANRWKVIYAATGTVNTSDANDKTAPQPITDPVLDAWGDVQLITFQWLDAIQQKGADLARWHFGVIAQQVRDSFLAHGLDGTRYGLLCYDEWEDEYKPVIDARENQETGEFEEYDTGETIQTQVAGTRWGIRPDQCLFLEAAYQRRQMKRIESRLALLEKAD